MSQKWLVEFTVSDSWIQDGFELTDLLALDMLEGVLPYAHSNELKAKVIKFPDSKIIQELQGY